MFKYILYIYLCMCVRGRVGGWMFLEKRIHCVRNVTIIYRGRLNSLTTAYFSDE